MPPMTDSAPGIRFELDGADLAVVHWFENTVPPEPWLLHLLRIIMLTDSS